MANYPQIDDCSGIWKLKDVKRAVMGGYWRSAAGGTSRGLFIGGDEQPAASNVIDFVTIASTGNAADFGNLTVAKKLVANAAGSHTKVVSGGGQTPSLSNVIDDIVVATTANATDFGDLTAAKAGIGNSSNATRALFFGRDAPLNSTDYVTMASKGNAVNFGNVNEGTTYHLSCASPTRAIKGSGASSKNIEFVEFATTGNGIDFGDLTAFHDMGGAGSSSTRGVFGGGYGPSPFNANSGGVTTIEHITMASLGNATDYGDLVVEITHYHGACNNSVRLLHGGGADASDNQQDSIEFHTITNGGNTVAFGDLTVTRGSLGGGSACHGGLNDGTGT